MAYNEQEERLLVKGSEKITRDLQVNGDIYINGNATISHFNDIDAPAAQFNSLNVNYISVSQDLNAQFINASSIIKSPSVHCDYLTVNYYSNMNSLTVGNNLIAENANISNLNVTNLAFEKLINNDLNVKNIDVDTVRYNYMFGNYLSVNYVYSRKYMSANKLYADDVLFNNVNVSTLNFMQCGYDVVSMKTMSEDDYNNLGSTVRNAAIYLTIPNGNMYVHGLKFTTGTEVTSNGYYIDLNVNSIPISTMFTTNSKLEFTTDPVTNNFNSNFNIGVMNITSLGNVWENTAPVGFQSNTASILTNAKVLYISNASSMYRNCSNLEDTFICNNSLIINAPSGYDPMKYCESMSNTFYNCQNFNSRVRIGQNVITTSGMLSDCSNFNQPITIPSNVLQMRDMFNGCVLFNSPVTFGVNSKVQDMYETFKECSNFNQPITIPNNVSNTVYMFYGCSNFNQPITIPSSVFNAGYMFYGCSNFNSPVVIKNGSLGGGAYSLYNMFLACPTLAASDVPIHISRSITIGNTSNYIYNALVNNYTGINWTGRILNDA